MKRLLILAAAAVSSALAQPTSKDDTPTPSPSDVVQLDPFVVNTDQDNGYQARNTLLGSRLNTQLRDIASPVSVMTKDYLQDVGAVTLDEALKYSLNVENTGEFESALTNGGDFNVGIINNYSANRSRGLSAAGRSHDLFTTNLAPDSYNFERITVASGPNSILFGLANSSGTIDVTFNRAKLDRAGGDVEIRTDDNKTIRGSLDYNMPLIKDKLAIRFDTLQEDAHTSRQPDFERDHRYFGALTFQPFRNTTFRAWYEHAELDRSPARNVVVVDNLTPWLGAGKPIFNNAPGVTYPGATDPVFSRNTTNTKVIVIGQTAGAVNTIAPWTNTVVTVGPDKLIASPDNLPQSLANSAIFPTDVNLTGNGTLNFTTGSIYGFSLEQHWKGFSVEAAFNSEKIYNPFTDMVRGIELALHADPNKFLPDGVTPNPNVGRYYMEGSGRGGLWLYGVREGRITPTYELDLRQWNKWLGHHRITGLISREQDYNAMQDRSSRIINNDTTYGNPNDNLNATARTVRFRTYVSNPMDPGTGGTFWVHYPGNAFEPQTFAGGVQVATVDNPYGATGTAALTNTSVDSRLITLQDYWLKDRIVTLVGARQDRVRQATANTPHIGTGLANSPFERIEDMSPYQHNYSFWDKGNTTFKSVVVYPFKWLSFYYSDSGTYAPSRSSHNPDGTLTPGSKGTGKDWGLTLDLWTDKLSLRLDRYEDVVGPDQSTYRAIVRDPVDQIELTIFNLGGNTQTGGYDPNQPQAFYEVVSNHRSTGYELELTANPTKNWRMMLMATKSDAVESNIGSAWLDYINKRISVWVPYASAPLYNNPAKTVSQEFQMLVVGINTMQQADGLSSEQARNYRLNFTNRYMFDSGWLKGFYVGGVYQWRGKPVLGYHVNQLANEFPFPGVPATVAVPDLRQPIYGKPLTSIDGFFGYHHKVWRGIGWNLQVNIRNVFDSNTIVAQQVLSTGQIARYTLQDPRTFLITNTFTF